MYVARAVAARNALLVELGFKGGSITMIRSRWFLIPFLLSVLLADTGMSQDQAVAVSAGRDGTAQITLANGEKITIQKEPGQVGISESHVGPDGTVGWLAEYKVEGVSYPIAGTLIIWRAGKTIRRLPTEQSFYSWTFYAQGKQVAYHVGPLHGELKSHCELHDATSGRLIARDGHSLHFGLSAAPTASQASVPGVVIETQLCSNDANVGGRTAAPTYST